MTAANFEELKAGLQIAQIFFLSTFVLPTLVYYSVDPSSDRRFPATISWTIRRGAAKVIHHLLWLAGWACVIYALRGETQGWVIFAVFMVSVGIVAVVLSPIGCSERMDAIHYAASAAYTLLHIPWMGPDAWRIPWMPYQLGFYTSLLLFILNEIYLRRYKQRHSARLEADLGVQPDSSEIEMRIENMPADDVKRKSLRTFATKLWRLQLAEMVLENAIFLFFVSGMSQ